MKQTLLKIYCAILVIAGWSASCTKMTGGDSFKTGTEALSGIGPVPSYTWTGMGIPGDGVSYPSNNNRLNIFTAAVGDTYYAWTGSEMEYAYKFNKSSLRWERKQWEGSSRLWNSFYCLFSYQSKLYFGLRDDGDPHTFGEFDPASGQATNLANFPADELWSIPRSFVVGDNGYLFFDGGYGKFWKYNFPTNTWTDLGRNPFGKRYDPAIVVIGEDVYVGLGVEFTNFGNTTIRSYKKDWVKMNIDDYTKTTLANFTGVGRTDAQTFVIGENIYVGFGQSFSDQTNSTTRYTDIYKYDISRDAWGRITDWPGARVSPLTGKYGNLSAFAVGKSAYVVTGGLNEFWRYSNQPIIVPTN